MPFGADVYNYMCGPNEFNVTGTLRSYDVSPRRHERALRVLFTVDRDDETVPDAVEWYRRLVPGAKVPVFEHSAHDARSARGVGLNDVDQTGPPTVRSATEADRQRMLDVLTLAFVADPLARWGVPDPTQYLAGARSFFDAFGGNGVSHGSVYVVDDFAGAALWLPPGVEPDGERLGTLIETYCEPRVVPEFLAVFARMATFHPDAPHWYLPLIGVDPAKQGRGYGAALMRHAAEHFDRENALAYLESSNPRNIPLYQRFGFEVLDTIRVGSSPPITPMLRRPV